MRHEFECKQREWTCRDIFRLMSKEERAEVLGDMFTKEEYVKLRN